MVDEARSELERHKCTGAIYLMLTYSNRSDLRENSVNAV